MLAVDNKWNSKFRLKCILHIVHAYHDFILFHMFERTLFCSSLRRFLLNEEKKKAESSVLFIQYFLCETSLLNSVIQLYDVA